VTLCIKNCSFSTFTIFAADFCEVDPLYFNRPFCSSVLWRCWLSYVACKNDSWNDLLCIGWDVKLYSPTQLCTWLFCVGRRDAYRQLTRSCIRTWRTADCAITRACVNAAIALLAVELCSLTIPSRAICSRLSHILNRSCLQCHVSEVVLSRPLVLYCTEWEDMEKINRNTKTCSTVLFELFGNSGIGYKNLTRNRGYKMSYFWRLCCWVPNLSVCEWYRSVSSTISSNLSGECLWCLQVTSIYWVAQKSKPLPKDQKIVLKHVSDIRFTRQIEIWIKHYNITLGIRYSMCDLLSELNNYAWPAN